MSNVPFKVSKWPPPNFITESFKNMNSDYHIYTEDFR